MQYIKAKNEAHREELKTEAQMRFKQAALVVRMLGAEKGQNFKVIDEFSFLWTDEERAKAKQDEIRGKMLNSMERQKAKGAKPKTADEQSRLLHELREKQLAGVK